jgi:5,5'-dehydrodivanillate O-demethylase
MTDTNLEFRRERNERLTRVGPGTPMGAYQRRFWHPVAALVELDAWPVKQVRLLGEDLALYRSDDGTLGLVARNFERVTIASYPVEVMGGLVWAYLGPAPAPLLPRYEHLVADGWNRSTGISRIPCNWLQIAENTLDPLHVEYLHMKFTNWARKQLGEPPIPERKHARVGYDLFRYGIVKKRLWEGDAEDSQEWTVGHPLVFPATLLVPYHAGWVQFQFRVPVDDTNTIVYWYDAKTVPPGEEQRAEVPLWENPWQTPEGAFMPEKINPQDMMVWITQGPITDHTLENLGESDRGVALYRRTLLDEIARVERGEDPAGVVRDPRENTPYIELPIEKEIGYSLAGAAASAAYAFPERDGTEIPLAGAAQS